MFDFTYSKDWVEIMTNAMITGLIAGLLAIVGVIVGEIISNKKIGEKFSATKEVLLKGQDVLVKGQDGSKELILKGQDGSKEVLLKGQDKLLGEHGNLSKEHSEMKEKLTFIERNLIAQQAEEAAKNNSLNHNQINLLSAVDSIKALGEEVKTMSLLNAKLETENMELKKENVELAAVNQELKKGHEVKKERGFER